MFGFGQLIGILKKSPKKTEYVMNNTLSNHDE